ncbi:MAG: PAS domain-containing protein [Chloroflexi bacterium]|nr:PAS domain-containing protein [Chloroflexota bacterium]
MKKNSIENKEWQKADARVLGQILAAQNIEFALPDTTRIAEFFAETLLAIPGIASCRVCIENVIFQKGEMENELCAGCETLQEITAGQNEIRPRGMGIRCMLAGQANMQINTIDSCQHHFGFFVFRIDDPDAFNVYKPFISNLSNYVAISLENRLQRDLLRKARGELELRVAERTEELKRTNEDLIREIAAHQQAEESLRKSEEELRAFFSQTIDGCFYMMLDEPVRWDETVDKERMLDYVFAHQHITQINDAMLAQYGATRGQMMGLTPNDFFKHNLEHGRDLWRRFLDAGNIRLESDERKLDGTSMWIEGEYIAIHDRQGRIIGHFGIQRDITKRKQMDETRREQYSTLHSIIESTDALIFSVDREYRYTSFNSAHAAVMRAIYNVEIQLGHSLWDYMTNAEDREKAKRNLDRALAGEHLVESAYSGEEKLSRLYFEVSHNPIAAGDGTVIGVAVFSHDITERKRAEEEIARSLEAEKKAREIAEILREANESLSRTLNLDDVLQNLLQYLNRLVPYDSANVTLLEGDFQLRVAALRGYERWTDIDMTRKITFDVRTAPVLKEVVATQKSLIIADTRDHPGWIRPAGAEHVISWLGVPIIAGRQVIGLYSADKTEPGFFTEEHRRLVEGLAGQAAVAIQNTRLHDQIKRANVELEQRVIDRTAQLEAANKELEAFAYSVSHDLRAPLRHIDGFVELLQKNMGISLDEKNRHYLDTIADSAKKMGILIDDLLSFSRMSRSEMVNTRVDLTELANEVIEELKPETENRKIQWLIGTLPQVRADRAMLRGVLVNLISNAIKFTRPRSHARIEIGVAQESPTEITIFIRDNGVGFDMNYADKLFGVFQRLHRTEDFEGTGIGLANVRRIINRHGGRTWAEGEIDSGATFYFSLPQSSEEELP